MESFFFQKKPLSIFALNFALPTFEEERTDSICVFREAEKLDEEMSVDYGHLKLKTEYWCCGDVTVSDKGGDALVRFLYFGFSCAESRHHAPGRDWAGGCLCFVHFRAGGCSCFVHV